MLISQSSELQEQHWELTKQIALQLRADDVDPNELRKVIRYLQVYSGKPGYTKLFEYLDDLKSLGSKYAQTKKTPQYYASLQRILSEHLKISEVQQDPALILQILGWSVRLMYFYKEHPEQIQQNTQPNQQTPLPNTSPDQASPSPSQSAKPKVDKPKPKPKPQSKPAQPQSVKPKSQNSTLVPQATPTPTASKSQRTFKEGEEVNAEITDVKPQQKKNKVAYQVTYQLESGEKRTMLETQLSIVPEIGQAVVVEVIQVDNGSIKKVKYLRSR